MRFLSLAIVLLLALSGCGGDEPAAQAPSPQNNAAPQPSPQTPAAPPIATKIEKPAGVEFKPLEFKIGEQAFTIEAPTDVKVDESQSTETHVALVGDKHFGLQIDLDKPPTTPDIMREFYERAGNLLVDTDDAVAGQERHPLAGGITARMAFQKQFDDQVCTVSTLDMRADKFVYYSPADALAMLYCASTLERKPAAE
jgi:hypothetical protein